MCTPSPYIVSPESAVRGQAISFFLALTWSNQISIWVDMSCDNLPLKHRTNVLLVSQGDSINTNELKWNEGGSYGPLFTFLNYPLPGFGPDEDHPKPNVT